MRGEGDLVVGDNEPYAVSDSTNIRVHGEARGLMNSGIEIRQDLIADQAGERQWADRLARIFRKSKHVARARSKHRLRGAPGPGSSGCRAAYRPKSAHRARVSASQMPPPIMKPPEMRDNSRVRRAEKNNRARPASSA